LIDRYRGGFAPGHSPDQLRVGIHSLSYVATIDHGRRRVFSGMQSFTEIGRGRGCHQIARLDAQLGPTGALWAIRTVAEKICV
jgi:hypothetical protein